MTEKALRDSLEVIGCDMVFKANSENIVGDITTTNPISQMALMGLLNGNKRPFGSGTLGIYCGCAQ